MEEDLLLGDAVAHVVDGVADDDGDEDLDDVVEDDGDAAPGEVLPVAPEVGIEGFQAIHHAGFILCRRD